MLSFCPLRQLVPAYSSCNHMHCCRALQEDLDENKQTHEGEISENKQAIDELQVLVSFLVNI